MNREEVIRRLKRIASHAVHVIGEEPFTLSLDDGIAASEAALLLERQQKFFVDSNGKITPLPIHPQWIGVKDRLPEQKECYLVYRSNFWGEYDGQICVCYWDGKYWCDSYEGAGADGFELTPGDVSHWMPLPEPPKEEDT